MGFDLNAFSVKEELIDYTSITVKRLLDKFGNKKIAMDVVDEILLCKPFFNPPHLIRQSDDAQDQLTKSRKFFENIKKELEK